MGLAAGRFNLLRAALNNLNARGRAGFAPGPVRTRELAAERRIPAPAATDRSEVDASEGLTPPRDPVWPARAGTERAA
jgi:hypothetical protein